MKRLKDLMLCIITLVSCLFFATSCGDDPVEDTNSGGTAVKETLEVVSSSIAEGATIDANTTEKITIKYSSAITIADNANITVNSIKVTCKKGAADTELDIPVTLENGMRYTVIIPYGSVCSAKDAKVKAAHYSFSFKTLIGTEASLPDNEATAVTRMLGFGWNLGNHFDSHNNGQKVTTWWDNATTTQELYQSLANAGVQTVRIPTTWGPWEGEAPDYKIGETFMNLVKKNVQWAKDAGLNVILNTHHDEYWQDAYNAALYSQTNEDIKARIVATWKQIAEAFKEEGDYLILETFNELNHDWKTPNDGELKIMNEWNQLAVNTIRETGGNNATRWIAVPSYQASPTYALDSRFIIPTDKANKLIVAVHCYDPYNFTLASTLTETWGHTLGNSNDEKNITTLLNKLKTKFIDKNIPCYLGEFGCSKHTTAKGNRCRDYYLEYFCRAAHYAGLAATLWDNNYSGAGSEHHAYFNHNDGSWLNGTQSIVSTMIKATNSTNSEYTLESIYNNAPTK